MWLPNQIFSNIILQYRCKRTGLRLTLQNVFMFLFLGNGVQKFPQSVRREDNKLNADVICLHLKTVRCSQCTLAWYEDLIKGNRCDGFTCE